MSGEDVVLELIKASMAKELTGEALHSLRVEMYPDFARDLFNVRASWNVLADVPRRVAYPVIDREPASWFQMFKREYFPHWAIARWPIRTRTTTRHLCFGLRKLYPDAPAVPERYGRYVIAFAERAAA